MTLYSHVISTTAFLPRMNANDKPMVFVKGVILPFGHTKSKIIWT